MHIFALLPAAGKSSRMGRAKLALPLGERNVLQRVLDTLKDAAINEILVVLGPHVAHLQPQAEQAGAQVLLLENETADMRATVLCGLDWLTRRYAPFPSDAFLLLPADHPLLSISVIDNLRKAAESGPTASIWIPTWAGRRGHPALITWSHVAGIRALTPGDGGLNVYLRAQQQEILEVPCPSPDILCDLDTPEDYDRCRSAFPG